MEPTIYEELMYKDKVIKDSLENMAFKNVRFENCIFDDICFKNVQFLECTFDKCNFKNVIFYNVSFYTTFILNTDIDALMSSCVDFRDSTTFCNSSLSLDSAKLILISYTSNFIKSIMNLNATECFIHGNFYNSFIAGEYYSCDFYGSRFSLCDFHTYSFCNNDNCKSLEPYKIIGIGLHCPEEGSYIAYKKVMVPQGEALAKLKIPTDAKRSSAGKYKCRASKAEILSITSITHPQNTYEEAYSQYDPTFIYKIGETVEVENFDNDRWNECTSGIHHFLSKHDAISY
jgi:hypothetical protein